MATRKVLLVSGGKLNVAGRCIQPQTMTHAAAFSTTQRKLDKGYKLVVVGGGAGGSAIANKFASKFGKDSVAVLDPAQHHYYQPMWTCVGAGIKQFNQSQHDRASLLPKGADWIREGASSFDPDNNKVTTESGQTLGYDYLVVATGVQLDYHKIKGAEEALKSDPNVCSNYHETYVKKTFPALQNFTGGNMVYSFPNGPIKCAGAPQKIAYLSDDYLRKNGKRDKATMYYNTSLPAIFGIPKYAEALQKVADERGINVNFRHSLIEVKPENKEAIFENLDTGETKSYEYAFLHIAPPCSPPDPVKQSPLVDATGFVDVNKETLQHNKYSNVFAIGDCSNVPTAKTAAAVAAQSGILQKTIQQVIDGKSPDSQYNGYTSCPLLTARGSCILAEFGYNGSILETFPVNQAKERRTMYHLKVDFMPQLYWHMLVKGMWDGPGNYRKLLRLGRA